MILKLMPFIDGPWLNSTSIFMQAKSAASIEGDFLMADLNKESYTMHSNADQKISWTSMKNNFLISFFISVKSVFTLL